MAKGDILSFDQPELVTIEQRRWDIRIHISWPDGRTADYIASADGALTEHDAIWFGTPEERDEWLA